MVKNQFDTVGYVSHIKSRSGLGGAVCIELLMLANLVGYSYGLDGGRFLNLNLDPNLKSISVCRNFKFEFNLRT